MTGSAASAMPPKNAREAFNFGSGVLYYTPDAPELRENPDPFRETGAFCRMETCRPAAGIREPILTGPIR